MIMIRSKLLRGAAVIGLFLFLVASAAEGALLGSSSLSLLRGGGGNGDNHGSGAAAGPGEAAAEGGTPAEEKVADKGADRHHRHRDLQTTAKIVGDNGSPSSAFPLGECEGDCDNDSDCESGLVCVQRSAGSALPSGCTGLSTSYTTDFCAKPSGSSGGSSSSGSSSVQRVGNDGSPSSAFPLGKCQGDCDNDGDCSGDLVCFQRRAYQSVPGCSGGTSDSTTTDYCVESSGSSGGSSGGSGTSTSDVVIKKWWQQGTSRSSRAGPYVDSVP
jgi:hypothetical protein